MDGTKDGTMIARREKRLSALSASRESEPGLYPDGKGLYLRIGPSGAKSWIFRFRAGGKRRDMGLGAYPAITLAEARQKAEECRKSRTSGIDPVETRKAQVMAQRLEDAKAVTFREAAERYIAAHSAGWRNSKHAAQWPSTLETYVYPVFGHLPVDAIDTNLVLKVLEPIWTTKTETATRVRGRIESVLGWAKSYGLRTGENPALWRGHLSNLLAPRSKVHRIKHHAALNYAEIGTFMERLRRQDGISPRALEFAILTATRTSETIEATWDEIDLTKAMWTLPGERMKAGVEHRVPLSNAAMAVLNAMREVRQNEFVFPGFRRGRPLSNMALLKTLERMKLPDLTTHGFRSTFRDWAAERSNFPSEVVEMALAHTISNKVEAAYRRGDLFQKRRKLMEAWANYCDAAEQGNVVSIAG
jgi:integrase